ncbi:MAG: methyltransferase type 12 [Lentisphaerae bacterium GWF2_45_14]|nr:MAG: methyltransferase type 12 [Lentisphaerae bacterium GWF2_45_14]
MFESRATATEFLDRTDCDPGLANASYRFMEMVNCRFGGIRVVQRFLSAEMAGRRSGVPQRVLDIGSGSCDIPLALSQWAYSNGIPLHFTCLEMAGHAIDIARGKLARAGNHAVELLQEDAFTHQPAEPYDYAVGSMCFHHFNNTQILTLLRRLRGFVGNSVLINDLRRSQLAFWAARLLLAGSGTPTGVRHDALLSIRRGFKINELNILLQQLDGVTVSVKPVHWFRVAAIIRFKQGENS